MAIETVNKRRSAVNLGLFGLDRLRFHPLNPDNTHTTDDGENALGVYIGFEIDLSSAVTPYETHKGRTIWYRLGSSHNRVYRIVISDAVLRTITRAYIEVDIVNKSMANPEAVTWNRLGQSRDRVYRIVVSDPVLWTITRAFVEVN